MSTDLTPTSYVVLATVASAGTATPYELKSMVNAGVGFFWSFPHSQLYSEPGRLAERGLLTEVRETSGRRRRRFEITEAGRAALAAWVDEPTDELPEIRDVALLKVFFSALGSGDGIPEVARAQASAHRERVATYEEMAADSTPGPMSTTLALGLAWERTAADFWDRVSREGLVDPRD